MFNIKRKRKEDELTYLERVYSKILKKDPNSFLYLPLASIYYHKGNIEKAIDALQKGLSVHSNYVTAKYYLAFLYRENGEVDKAAKMFEKVTCDSLGHYAAHKALVQYYLDKKDEKSALTELKKMTRFVPPGKAWFGSCVSVNDQKNRLEQNLKEDKKTLTSIEEDTAWPRGHNQMGYRPGYPQKLYKKNTVLQVSSTETHISAKEDEGKTRKRKNVSEIITPQLKKQSERKDGNLKSTDTITCSLENWLKNIDRIYEKA